MNLQLFAEPPAPAEPNTEGIQTPQQTTDFDYEKLASIVSGKQTVAEDTVLKGYFKQQGLSQEEMTQAISTFKQQKQENTPDVGALQAQVATLQAAAVQKALDKEATLEAIKLGLPVDSVPYVLKMADFTDGAGEDGKINSENVKKAIEKVLEAIPALKPPKEQSEGFQVGADLGNKDNKAQEDVLKGIFGIKN